MGSLASTLSSIQKQARSWVSTDQSVSKFTISADLVFQDAKSGKWITSLPGGICGYTNKYEFSKNGMVQKKSSPQSKLKEYCDVFPEKTYKAFLVSDVNFPNVPMGSCQLVTVRTNMKFKIFISALLLLSASFNIVFYFSNKYPSLVSLSGPFWVKHSENSFSYSFAGYLKWNDQSKQSTTRQFWNIQLDVNKNSYTCKILDIWEELKIFDKNISMSSPTAQVTPSTSIVSEVIT